MKNIKNENEKTTDFVSEQIEKISCPEPKTHTENDSRPDSYHSSEKYNQK